MRMRSKSWPFGVGQLALALSALALFADPSRSEQPGYPSIAAESSASVRALTSEEARSIEDARERQQRIVESDDRRRELAKEYSRTLAAIERLTQHRQRITGLAATQMVELDELTREMETVPAIAQHAMPLMERMLESIEAFIRADLPFNLKPRLEQVAEARRLFARPDVKPADKIRVVMKLYATELEYGRTIEAYEGAFFVNLADHVAAIDAQMAAKEPTSAVAEDAEVPVEDVISNAAIAGATDGLGGLRRKEGDQLPSRDAAVAKVSNEKTEERYVTFLRYGRLSLAYQTLDGKETGLWDKRTGTWAALEGGLAAEVRAAIAIARKRVPPDLMIVPVFEGAKR